MVVFKKKALIFDRYHLPEAGVHGLISRWKQH